MTRTATKPAMTPAQRQELYRARKAARGKAKDIALSKIKTEARTIADARQIAAAALEEKQ